MKSVFVHVMTPVIAGNFATQELWCKKGPPTSELIAHFTPQPPLPAKMSLPATRPDAALVDKMAALADRLGLLLQNEHQVGFHFNDVTNLPLFL